MVIDVNSVYRYVQDLFQRGLVIIVGSGASCAYGLPSMQQLSRHLMATIPGLLIDGSSREYEAWAAIGAALASDRGLESALNGISMPEALGHKITQVVSECVRESEATAISGIMNAETEPAFGRLLSHSLQASTVVDVVTTNYDRLIEIFAARAGVRLDSMFYGHTVGRLDKNLSQQELLKATTRAPKSPKAASDSRNYHSHVRLSKPHGSLDWFKMRDNCYRSDLPMDSSRQIIAPGGAKYRLGYEVPFDAQRIRANEAIDAAAALLFVGYGFNDDHLQTHLRAKIASTPTVAISKHLTENTRAYLSLNEHAVGIEEAGAGGSRIYRSMNAGTVAQCIWTVDGLVEEVIKV